MPKCKCKKRHQGLDSFNKRLSCLISLQYQWRGTVWLHCWEGQSVGERGHWVPEADSGGSGLHAQQTDCTLWPEGEVFWGFLGELRTSCGIDIEFVYIDELTFKPSSNWIVSIFRVSWRSNCWMYHIQYNPLAWRYIILSVQPENIMLSVKDAEHPNIKLIDFGLAHQFKQGEEYKSMNGTPQYIRKCK